MKKSIILLMVSLMVLSFTSCQKEVKEDVTLSAESPLFQVWDG